VAATLKHLNGVTLSGDKATETNFKREAAKGASIIHLAVHAFTDEVNPDRAGLVFASDDSNDDGLLQVREIRRLPLATTALVTLSACDTSAGPIEGEEGVFSIADAFLDAGARTAVATYWMIEDSSTSELMKIFYTSLSHGQRPAAALRAAQLGLLNQGQEAKAPFYWAAFNVTGDGSRAIEWTFTHDK
jgi:CHAT domain-containing protein